MKNQLLTLLVAKIKLGKRSSKCGAHYFNHLVESIKLNGVTSPIVVRKNKSTDLKYQCVDGNLRIQACKKLGIKEIPCCVLAVNPFTEAQA